MLLFMFLVYAAVLTTALGVKGFRAGAPRRAVATAPVDPNPTRVLIVGATGGTGRQLVSQALGRGFHVTALVRKPAAFQLEHPRLRVLVGDVLDPISLKPAMAGQHAVISALGHRRY